MIDEKALEVAARAIEAERCIHDQGYYHDEKGLARSAITAYLGALDGEDNAMIAARPQNGDE